MDGRSDIIALLSWIVSIDVRIPKIRLGLASAAPRFSH